MKYLKNIIILLFLITHIWIATSIIIFDYKCSNEILYLMIVTAIILYQNEKI